MLFRLLLTDAAAACSAAGTTAASCPMLLLLLLSAAEAAAAAAPPPSLLLIPLFASSLVLRLQASLPVPPPSSSLRWSQRSRDSRPRSCGRAWPLDAALARVARVTTMGKRGSRSAASSAGDGDWAAPGAEDDDLTSRVRRWKSEHPARDYGGQPLQHVQPSDGLGISASQARHTSPRQARHQCLDLAGGLIHWVVKMPSLESDDRA